MKLKFLDLFAGAGGLSEGFIQEGYDPIVHVEMDQAACFTIKTRLAFHWLNANKKTKFYNSYLDGKISREELYSKVPSNIINSVLNEEISNESLHNIFKKTDKALGKESLDLIIGGPPCQAYSIVGRSRDKNGMKGDKRNYLYKFYAEFLKRYQPKFFVFENVLGLLSAKDIDGVLYFKKMKQIFKESGYEIEYEVIDSSEYKIPQARKRIFLVGKLNGEKGFFPKLEKHYKKIPVKDVFHDLPSLNAGEGMAKPQPLKRIGSHSYLFKSGIRQASLPNVTWHQSRPNNKQDLSIYKIVATQWNEKGIRVKYNSLPDHLKTHNNTKSFLDRFKAVSFELPCHTIVAHISKDGHYYIHPEGNRSLSVREAARIQTFPDNYYFEGVTNEPSRTAAFKQIGNAVPVLLAKQIAISLKQKFFI